MSTATSDATFKADVLDSAGPVLVDFWAPWCGPCRMVGPIIDRIAQAAGDRAKVYQLNVDENPVTASQYGITAIPTVLVFRSGKIEKQMVGVQPEATYRDAVGI